MSLLASVARIEPLVLLLASSISSRSSVTQQLLQDRLCLQVHHLPADTCRSLASPNGRIVDITAREAVMSDVASYLSLKELLSILPCLLLTAATAAWCDKYPNGRRLVILASAVGHLLESVLLLLVSVSTSADFRLILMSSLPSSVLGSGFMTALFSFLSVTTHAQDRSSRFLLISISFSIGFVAGSLFTGKLVDADPLVVIADDPRIQLHNCGDIILLDACLCFVAGAWAAVCIPAVPVALCDASLDDTSEDEEPIVSSTDQDEAGETATGIPEPDCMARLWRQLTALCHPDSLLAVWRTGTRERDTRSLLWFCVAIHALILVPYYGYRVIGFPISERLYSWDTRSYAYANAGITAVQQVIVTAYSLLIVKRLSLKPTTVVLIGSISSFLGLVLSGSFSQCSCHDCGISPCIPRRDLVVGRQSFGLDSRAGK